MQHLMTSLWRGGGYSIYPWVGGAVRPLIHPMQIWRTTPSLPGTSCMKARLDGPQCFFKRSLRKALLHWQSSLFYFAMPMSFLNATRWDRNCPVFASKGKMYIHTIHQDKASEFMIAAGTEICLLHFQVGRPLIENCLND